jgi:ParB-like chromosome segregation protein Spo0J
MRFFERKVPVGIADLWAIYQRLDERVAVHLEGMQRYGDRLDKMETRLRHMETDERGESMRQVRSEQQRLREHVESLEAISNRSAPIMDALARVAGWIVAGVVGLVFAAMQMRANAAPLPIGPGDGPAAPASMGPAYGYAIGPAYRPGEIGTTSALPPGTEGVHPFSAQFRDFENGLTLGLTKACGVRVMVAKAKTRARSNFEPIRAAAPGAAPDADGAAAAPVIDDADPGGAARALLEGRHLQVALRPIGALRAYARNARTHSPEQIGQIAESMRAFGWTAPILADPHGEVIAGHGRLEAALRLGLDTVPVVTLDHLTADQRRALVLADNQLATLSDWDEAILAAELAELAEAQFDLGVIGFDDAALRDLLNLDAEELALPELPTGDRPPFQHMAFTLHETQLQRVRQALALISAPEAARWESVNTNRNANALAALCDRVLAAAAAEGATDAG